LGSEGDVLLGSAGGLLRGHLGCVERAGRNLVWLKWAVVEYVGVKTGLNTTIFGGYGGGAGAEQDALQIWR